MDRASCASRASPNGPQRRSQLTHVAAFCSSSASLRGRFTYAAHPCHNSRAFKIVVALLQNCLKLAPSSCESSRLRASPGLAQAPTTAHSLTSRLSLYNPPQHQKWRQLPDGNPALSRAADTRNLTAGITALFAQEVRGADTAGYRRRNFTTCGIQRHMVRLLPVVFRASRSSCEASQRPWDLKQQPAEQLPRA